ncbi:unnamed protein product [Orchesella dallaii]|uniref:DM10 domain-containing protein n=1 Tax=Orchesella dallaii TaxID=48710 RepID=A0ABP1S2L8_9HEXA
MNSSQQSLHNMAGRTAEIPVTNYSSTGFVPTTASTPTTKGFLDRYNISDHTLPYVPPTTSSRKFNTASAENPFACRFVIPPGLEDCPALDFDDICDTCCAPEKPICSQDPNCHMFKECGKNNYNGSCKYLRARGPRIPSWLAHCGRVLTFYGFFQEPVPESDKETYRIRKVLIRFYMDDSTVDVFEPKTFDPGFTQGRLIRRHRIPLPPPADSEFYTMEHFNVGCEVEFYSKTFLICGCNEPTRKYLQKLGIPVPQNLEVPDDPYTIWRKDRITSLFARKARIDLTQGKFKSFLLNNRKVLRFWAFWDDRCSEHGHLRKFIIHFFLEDDTVEIKEIPHDTRTEVFPTFLSRSKLFKDYKELVTIPGNKEEALLILNTTGGCQTVFMGQTFLEDRLCPGIDQKSHIKDRDLAIGAVLNIYGRAFIITDCDAFTKQYYQEKYGIQDFTPLTLTDEETRKDELPRMKTPPHIGIGDEVDTRANWDKIDIHPPRRDELSLLVMEK